MRTDSFDPIAYIESGFLDTRQADAGESDLDQADLKIPDFSEDEYRDLPEEEEVLIGISGKPNSHGVDVEPARFRKTVMSAPRPRRSKAVPGEGGIDPDLSDTWQSLPKNVAFLCSFFDDGVTKNYYRGEFKESRQELIRRLLDPELSLEETARLLGVCPATVRRYTNRQWLAHHRTQGGQRRFRLSNIVKFVDEHGRLPEE